MATLSRPKVKSNEAPDILLKSSIPTPFPSGTERERIFAEELEELAHEAAGLTENGAMQSCISQSQASTSAHDTASSDVLREVMPSIAYVEKSCLMILNNLLSVPTKWNPIVPDRRYSMPAAQSLSTPQVNVSESSSALQTLVSNLRSRDNGEVLADSRDLENESRLFHELRTRVESLTCFLDSKDATLALALVSLLAKFHRLSTIQSTRPGSRGDTSQGSHHDPIETPGTVDVFDTLKRQLNDLQIERRTQPERPTPGVPPVLVVESALLWSQIDEDLENVASMCKERTEGLPRFSPAEHLPPQYDAADYTLDTPPEYDHGKVIPADVQESKNLQRRPSTGTTTDEKMRLDLEAVTMAIDRLYLVAPQLHDQRVELKSAKLKQMENARTAGPASTSKPIMHEGQKEGRDVRELEGILDLLGKASERTLTDQSVVVDGGMKTRLEKARIRDQEKRNAFVEQLFQHSNAGRLHGQDAVLQRPRTKDPNALLTLPEFIREAVPDSVRMADPNAVLSLPEFIKEPVPEHVTSKPLPAIKRIKPGIKLRSRSMSAPPLAWFLPSQSKSSLSNAESKNQTTTAPSSSRTSESSGIGFNVSYIAENYQNLHHVLVFVSITGATPGTDVEAEVLPYSPDGEHLIIKSGLNISSPLSLPGRTTPGKKEVKVQGSHYEVKLNTASSPIYPATESAPLLDASQLLASAPTNFICASCSLPLVQSSRIQQYRDLPSEHWEELVEAWMCHADQTLNEHVAKHGRGFWPEAGQALVGGSYILFEESSVVGDNLCPAELSKRGDDWRVVRCLCGSVTGRRQQHQSSTNDQVHVYRLLKYAIRPVSPTAEPSKVPLSAFIVEDMVEFMQAHATYRFVVLDEEDEEPRILIWLFKPSIRIAYATPTAYTLPKSGSIHAAKVLFKILGPSAVSHDLKSILNKYPGFPQAEYLFYPIDICRRLAGLLKESNMTYPDGMRTMTGLDVGWLHRG